MSRTVKTKPVPHRTGVYASQQLFIDGIPVGEPLPCVTHTWKIERAGHARLIFTDIDGHTLVHDDAAGYLRVGETLTMRWEGPPAVVYSDHIKGHA